MKLKAASGIMLALLFICMLKLAFNIQPTEADPARLTLETDKDVYILGENVTVILTNVGNKTVNIAGWPAWTIYTYPEEEPVFPAAFTLLLWSLKPGENDTFGWDQYNYYTDPPSPVEPGMFFVNDTQEWGLSTYFEIIAAPVVASIFQ